MKRTILAVALAVLVPGSLAAAPPVPPQIATGVVMDDRYPSHEVTFPNGVRGLPGLIYWQPVGYRPLTLDLYLPPVSAPRPEAGVPLVVFIHGGGWMGGDARRNGTFVDFPSVLASLSARGYAVASVEYRLSGEAPFPAQLIDVKAAVKWLRLQAPVYGIDPLRTVTWGVSAGAHLAALAAVTGGEPSLVPAQPPEASAADVRFDAVTPATRVSDAVQGCVAWYGVFDLSTIVEQARRSKAFPRDVSKAPEWRLLGCPASGCTVEQLSAASPVTYVDEGDPPMLLITGKADRTVPYEQTLQMAAKLKASGVKREVIVMDGVDHNFIGRTPQETLEANMRALDETFIFIDRAIGFGAAQEK